jgi:putative heme-binding domain-containing protein
MSGFAPGIPEDDIRRMVAYIRSVNRHDTSPPPGDPGRGEALFWQKGACGGCHRVGARGAQIAPDLTRVGRRRSLAYLRESVVAPSAAIAPGYATIQVNLPDGRTITGVEKGLDNFTVQLMDLEGRFYSFEKSAAVSVKRVPDSLMPSYGGLLSPAELTDLVAYLARLRGEEVQP